MNKDHDNSQTEQQLQKEARIEESRSIAWATHGHTWKVFRPQENTTSSKELIGRQLHLETESSCDSNLLRRMTDDKKHRQRNTRRNYGLQKQSCSRRRFKLPSKDLGGSQKCTSDCQIVEQFQKEDGEERTHTSRLP